MLEFAATSGAQGRVGDGRSAVVLLADPLSPASLEQLAALRAALGESCAVRDGALPDLGLQWTDRESAERLLAACADADWVVLVGVRPAQLDAMFRLRLEQILRGAEPSRARSAVLLAPPAVGDQLPRSFRDRAVSSWPFAGLDLAAPAALQAGVGEAIGLRVERGGADHLARLVAARPPAALTSFAREGQTVALLVHFLGGRCGSTTVFENQAEELVRAGHFVLRVYINETETAGATLLRDWPRIVRENSVSAGAHVDAMAVAPGAPQDGPLTEQSAYGQFVRSIVGRSRCELRDEAVAAAIGRAETVVLNHAITAGFALRFCPHARILLETHDYLARWAFNHARDGAAGGTFETRGELLRMARLEADLWRVADLCTSLSLGERKRIGRHNPRSALVFPRPYVVALPPPPDDAFQWDAVLSGDNHAFNVASLRWLIDLVLPHEPALQQLRVAIVGRVGQQFDTAALEAGTNVRFLGFVDDLEALRASCRLTLVPDQDGTGVAVKALTALAAGHPVVTTRAGLRGLDPGVARLIPAHEDATSFAADLLRLVRDPAALGARRAASRAAYVMLAGGSTYLGALSRTPPPGPAMLERRSRMRARMAALSRHLAEDSPRHGRAFELAGGGNGATLLAAGWHKGEAWGRWMDGDHAALEVPASADLSSVDSIDIIAIAPFVPVSLEVVVDGLSIGSHVVELTETRLSYMLPADRRKAEQARTVHLRASAADSLSAATHWGDARVLGPGIARIWFEPVRIYPCDAPIEVADEATDHVLVEGWHGREAWGRWMDGDEAVISLHVDRPSGARCVLVLDLAPCSAGGSIAVTVNGVRLGERVVLDGLSRWLLPPEALADGTGLRITLRSSRVWRPSERTESTDRRLLGVGLRRLWLAAGDDLLPAVRRPPTRAFRLVAIGRSVVRALFRPTPGG